MVEIITKAKKINERINDFDQLTINLVNMGICYQYLDMPDSALHFLNRGLNIAFEKKLEDLECSILQYIGTVYVDKKEFNAAKKYLLQSIEKAKSTQNKVDIKANRTPTCTRDKVVSKSPK